VLALIAEGRTGRQIAGRWSSAPDYRHARVQHPGQARRRIIGDPRH
jgi:hypothetical protein